MVGYSSTTKRLMSGWKITDRLCRTISAQIFTNRLRCAGHRPVLDFLGQRQGVEEGTDTDG